MGFFITWWNLVIGYLVIGQSWTIKPSHPYTHKAQLLWLEACQGTLQRCYEDRLVCLLIIGCFSVIYSQPTFLLLVVFRCSGRNPRGELSNHVRPWNHLGKWTRPFRGRWKHIPCFIQLSRKRTPLKTFHMLLSYPYACVTHRGLRKQRAQRD